MLSGELQDLYKKIIVSYTKGQSYNPRAFASELSAVELSLWSELVFLAERLYESLLLQDQERERAYLTRRIRQMFLSQRLKETGLPWVIENVEGAKPFMCEPIMLCGSMFGLGTGDAELRRHRLFELSGFTMMTPRCQHYTRHRVIGVYGGHGRDHRRTGGASVRDGTQQFSTAQRAEAMGIDWMTGAQLSQSIPPAYTEYIGKQLMAVLV